MKSTPVTTATLFLPVDEHVRRLVAWMTESIYEKEQLAAMALLCAVAGENIFLLGPPGTAKSLVARRLKGVMKDARAFEYLMSRFSTPDELFGPISITRLKESDSYERLTDGYLPSADVVFLDEIWKAGPSIQNTLLTAINEHLYHNGTVTMHLPMKVLIAASNELPPAGEGLEALWDRFLVRMVSNCIESDDNFEKMLLAPDREAKEVDADIALTPEIYSRWQSDARAVTVPASIIDSLKALRHALAGAGSGEEEPKGDYYVSDRRWKKVFRLMQTSAYLNGRTEVDCSDLLLLIHCLWNAPECREKVNGLVTGAMWSSVKMNIDAVNEQLRAMVSTDGGGRKALPFVPDTEFKVCYNSYYAVDGYADVTALIPSWDYKKLSLIDETSGVVFTDHSLRMPVIQIENNNTVFNLPSNSGKPRRVKLLKCNGGLIVNSIPYSLVRKGGMTADSTGASVPLRKDCAALKRRFTAVEKSWHELKKLLSTEASSNIFVSEIDSEMLAQSMTDVDRLLTETGIRLNNVAKIAR